MQTLQTKPYQPLLGVKGQLTSLNFNSGLRFKYEYLDIQKTTSSKQILFASDIRIVFAIQGQSEVRIGHSHLRLKSNSQQAGAVISVKEDTYGYKQLHMQKNKKELVLFLSKNWLAQNLFTLQYRAVKQVVDSHLHCFYFSITPMMQQILNRFCSPQLHCLSKLQQQSFVLMLIDEVLEQIEQKPKPVKVGEQLLSAIEKLVLLLQSASGDALSINEMARFCHSNPTTLQRVFKQHYGQSIGAYKRHWQLARAQMALLNGASIVCAAQIAGYQHMQSFSQAFKRQFDCLPKDVRR